MLKVVVVVEKEENITSLVSFGIRGNTISKRRPIRFESNRNQATNYIRSLSDSVKTTILSTCLSFDFSQFDSNIIERRSWFPKMPKFVLYIATLLLSIAMLWYSSDTLSETGTSFHNSFGHDRSLIDSNGHLSSSSPFSSSSPSSSNINPLHDHQQQLHTQHKNSPQSSSSSLSVVKTSMSSKESPLKLLDPSQIKARYLHVQRQTQDSQAQLFHRQSDGGRQSMTYSQYNPLKLMPVINPELVNVTRVMLVTYFRSGSSFLGDLMQQNWKTFYTFEPFHYMTDGMRIKDDRREEAYDLLTNLYTCEYPKIGHYVRWALKPENRFLFKWNSFLWSVCRLRPSSCFNASFLKEACLRASAQVVKATRLHMRHVQEWMSRLKSTSSESNNHQSVRDQLKIVYLVRDPRGIYASRRGLTWCSNSTCANPASLCAEMSEDMEVFEQLRTTYPGRVFLVRYEDMALSPRDESLKLFHNVELPFSPSVSRFLKTHTQLTKSTNRDVKNPYSTKRDSKSVAFEWRRLLKGDELSAVEIACSDVIKRLGYKIITDDQLMMTTIDGTGSVGRGVTNGGTSVVDGGTRSSFDKQTLLEELPKELTGR